jgi:hypothetical protein
MSEQATEVDIDRLAELVRSEPDEERDCLLCQETMAAPDLGYEATPLCSGCSHVALGRLAAEVERLRAMATPSPAGTVRIFCPDGPRDVDSKERCGLPGESWEDSTVCVGHVCGHLVETRCGTARVESWEQEAMRLRARLEAVTTPSSAGTVRLLYPDGTHRDVDPAAPVPRIDGEGTVRRDTFPRWWWSAKRHGTEEPELDLATDWDAADGSAFDAWVTVRVETFEQEAARERAARLEVERQRDEDEARIATWLGDRVADVDPGQPGAREVVAELRRRAAEVRTGAWRAEGDKR